MIKFFKNGFTLIELLIVIAIIGILAALIMTNVQGIRERARDARRKSDLNALKSTLRLYYNDQKSFPGDTSGQIEGCGGLTTACSWGSGNFTLNGTTYMGTIPSDPSSTATNTLGYYYHYVSDDSYALVAKLENLSDQDIADSQGKCSTAYTSYKNNTSDEDPTRDYVICE